MEVETKEPIKEEVSEAQEPEPSAFQAYLVGNILQLHEVLY